jgi:hypothetical protein
MTILELFDRRELTLTERLTLASKDLSADVVPLSTVKATR